MAIDFELTTTPASGAGDYTFYPSVYPPTISDNLARYSHWPVTYEPTQCVGKAHVFECDHVESCQCGKKARDAAREEGSESETVMATNHMTLEVTKMPEVLWAMRRELANILRDEAEGEDPRVARKLREIAAMFEAGQ